MDFLNKAVAAVIPSCIGLVSKNIAYPFKVSDNVKALELTIEELEAVQDHVKNRVQNAELQGFTQNKPVEQWLGQVEVVRGEVDDIRNRYEKRSRSQGAWSFGCWSNYWISRDATKKLMEVQVLRDRGNFEEVATQLPPQIQELPVESGEVSKEEAGLQEILRYIDDNQYNTIGIWGMGGVGKTRLLHLVHNYCKSSSSFDVVIFITASKDCSIEKLQTELRQQYGFGRGINVESQAIIIRDYLFNRNFLILLDDLWEQIDLERVGIPFPLGLVNKFKRNVVLTTRSLRVCGLMDVQKTHKVVGLHHNDALHLFYEKVGDETINSHPQTKSLAEEVVKELDGLPLALITIGRAMHGKRDPREWDDVIDLLKKSRLNEIETTREEEKIYHRLKFSYDSLESRELKDCFLACSLWPDDYIIQKFELIEFWMGLGLLDAFDAQNPYNPGYTLISKLLSVCLLEEYSLYCVKMHDVIRDMALWIAHDFGKEREKWIVRQEVGAHQVLHEKNHWCQAERATLFLDSQDIVKQSIPCEANKLQFLIVKNYKSRVETVVKNLEFFCALTFLNLSHCNLISFPQDISNLVNLRYLNLSVNDISFVPEELKLFTNLRYLLLQCNCIASFPKGVITELKELRILDLFVNKINFEHLTWVIKEIECLENIRSLGITLQHASHFRSLLELPNLPIRYLEFDYIDGTDILLIPGSFIGNSKIQNNLYRLKLKGKSINKIEIKSDSQNPYCHLKYLEFLRIEGMELLEEIVWPNIAPKDLFLGLCFLHIYSCGKLKDASWILHLPCLQKLEFWDCENMIQLIEHFDLAASVNEERVEMLNPTFPSLEILDLRIFPNLQIISDQSIMFPSLKRIYIIDCPKLKKLPFQSNTVPSNLKTIDIDKECWENLEWEDNDLKQILQPFVSFTDQ